MEAESSLRNVVLYKNGIKSQKINNCINIQSSRTFRPGLNENETEVAHEREGGSKQFSVERVIGSMKENMKKEE
jgi:hypothetical protein